MTSWKHRYENPAVLAASVASLVTLVIAAITAASAWWTSHVQADAEVEKARIEAKRDNEKSIRDTQRALIVAAFMGESSGYRLQAYIESGVLDDPDCKLRIVILHYSNDCKPPESGLPIPRPPTGK